ncbi:hypothetical protein FOL47_004593 [Perkinsus chesapeaki]|uniref:Uncharacterized protein n=1 Tax=Perkinsus chesapeaki TaxID=330153 RepID=A0A7J6N0A8_PERCH|nr:hypothetical protein FOL47_004593 [Perkinsus chesapeaki]
MSVLPSKLEFASAEELLALLPNLTALWDDLMYPPSGLVHHRTLKHDDARVEGIAHGYTDFGTAGDPLYRSSPLVTPTRIRSPQSPGIPELPNLDGKAFNGGSWEFTSNLNGARISNGGSALMAPSIAQLTISERTTHRSALLERRRAQQKASKASMSRGDSADWERLSQFSMPGWTSSGG